MASFAMDLLEMAGPRRTHRRRQRRIMLNILAERVLGLPQDVRVDKGILFSEVPTGRTRRRAPFAGESLRPSALES